MIAKESSPTVSNQNSPKLTHLHDATWNLWTTQIPCLLLTCRLHQPRVLSSARCLAPFLTLSDPFWMAVYWPMAQSMTSRGVKELKPLGLPMVSMDQGWSRAISPSIFSWSTATANLFFRMLQGCSTPQKPSKSLVLRGGKGYLPTPGVTLTSSTTKLLKQASAHAQDPQMTCHHPFRGNGAHQPLISLWMSNTREPLALGDIWSIIPGRTKKALENTSRMHSTKSRREGWHALPGQGSEVISAKTHPNISTSLRWTDESLLQWKNRTWHLTVNYIALLLLLLLSLYEYFYALLLTTIIISIMTVMTQDDLCILVQQQPALRHP